MLHGEIAEVIVGLGDGRTAECVGFDDVSTGLKKRPVDFGNNFWLGKTEKFIVALQIGRVVGEALATKIRFCQVFGLYHGAHGTIDDKNTLLEGLLQKPGIVFDACH